MLLLGVLGIAYFIWLSYKRYEQAFLILVSITLLTHTMFTISNSTIAYSDILWVIYIVLFLRQHFSFNLVRSSYLLWGFVFTVLYIFIPLLGFYIYKDISLFNSISPSLRFLQWLSYGGIAYLFTIKKGQGESFAKKLLVVFGFVVALHSFYSLFQFMAYFGWFDYNVLPHKQFYEGKKTWFYWWRGTGFLHNPNTLGVLGSLTAATFMLFWFNNLISKKVFFLFFGGAVAAILLSSSRTAILILAITILSSVIFFIKRESFKKKILLLGGLLVGSLLITFPFMADKFIDRFLEIFLLFGNVNQIENLTGRAEFWSHAISILREDTHFYPHILFMKEFQQIMDLLH